MEQSRNKIFLGGDRTSRSVLNLIWHTTHRSDVNWLSGIPPAPTIRYAKKHLEGSQEGYSCLVVDTYIARASFSLSASFAAEAISTKISFVCARIEGEQGERVGVFAGFFFPRPLYRHMNPY